jgi:glycerophosphoryl diester phosphodiesterase
MSRSGKSRRVILRTAVALLAAVVVIVGAAWQFAPRLVSEPMLIIARRGDIAHFPENTLEGIVSAANKGADGIEFDLQRSGEGTWFVFHDRDLSAITDGTGDITKLTDTQIGAVTITGGLGYRGDGGVRIPTLEAVLNALADYDGILMLDVKMPGTQHHADIASLVLERSLNAEIATYTVEAAEAVKEVDPGLRTYMPGTADGGHDHRAVDASLVYVSALPWPSVLLWPAGSVYSVVPEIESDDEREMIKRAHRWGAAVFLTNRLDDALAWSSERR